MATIYGVDTKKPYDAKDVRDAIVRCFTQAHGDVLEDFDKYVKGSSEKDVKKVKKLHVKEMVKNIFKENKDDFNNPTKKSLIRCCDSLAKFAKNFRDPGIIKGNYDKISKLIEKL